MRSYYLVRSLGPQTSQIMAIHIIFDSAIVCYRGLLRQFKADALELVQLVVDERGLSQTEGVLVCYSKSVGKIQLYFESMKQYFLPEECVACY